MSNAQRLAKREKFKRNWTKPQPAFTRIRRIMHDAAIEAGIRNVDLALSLLWQHVAKLKASGQKAFSVKEAKEFLRDLSENHPKLKEGSAT
jgi:hypothetical protein